MEAVYLFLSGPGIVFSLGIFVTGLAVRLALYVRGLGWRRDRVAYRKYFGRGLRGGVHSILVWLIPFGTNGWRSKPLFSLSFFLFHAGLVIVPLFLAAHNEIFRSWAGFSLPSLPGRAADLITATAIAAGCYLLARRLILPQVRLLSTWKDYGLLILSLCPLVTGLCSRLAGTGTDLWMIGHLASGELLLVLAPFTRLSHMVLFFASRWQIGADFAIKRGGETRGSCFPW